MMSVDALSTLALVNIQEQVTTALTGSNINKLPILAAAGLAWNNAMNVEQDPLQFAQDVVQGAFILLSFVAGGLLADGAARWFVERSNANDDYIGMERDDLGNFLIRTLTPVAGAFVSGGLAYLFTESLKH